MTTPLEDNKSNEKYKYVLQNQHEKSKTGGENDEKGKLGGLSDKNMLSRSKEKKDYISNNIAKISRRKE